MVDYFRDIQNTIMTWEGVSAHPHRFGGVEFDLGRIEIGHLHQGGLVDIPFTKKIKQQLIAETKASNHHVLPDSGWISFRVHSQQDAEHAIWLFRLSYLHKLSRRPRHASGTGQPPLDFREELSHLELSAPLRAILDTNPQ